MFRVSGLKLVITGFLLFLASIGFAGLSLAGVNQVLTNATDLTVPLSELPRQGLDTYRLIAQGGPFPYDKDGVVFGNRERLLPGQKRGFYREYTVKTPGERDRGARRIVCGGEPRAPEVCYYSADHYASFRRIVP